MNDSATKPDIVRVRLRDYFFGDLRVSDFEQWLYSDATLEKVFGTQRYLDLIGLNYAEIEDLDKSRALVEGIYSDVYGENLIKDHVRDIVEQMLSGTLGLELGCKELWDLRNAGAAFIPPVFVGYASELGNPGMESFYRERLLEDARQLLSDLGPK